MKQYITALLTLFLVLLFPNRIEGKQPYAIHEYNDCYAVDSVRHAEWILEIKNIADENIWILFENDDTISDKTLINNRFRSRRDGGMSLYHWMVDGNVNWGEPCLDLFSDFFKILPPNESFYVVSESDSAMFKELKNKLRVLSNSEIKLIFKPLSLIEHTAKPSYQPNVLIIK